MTTHEDMIRLYIIQHQKRMQERLEKALEVFSKRQVIPPTPELLLTLRSLAEQIETNTGERAHNIIYALSNNEVATMPAINQLQKELITHQKPWIAVDCVYYSGSYQYLKCAVNPNTPCRDCKEYEPAENS
jgi:hypothetical protein